MTVADTAPRPSPTTTELLGAAGGGDHAAWEQLVRRFEPAVMAMIRSYRLQEADALDAAQRTWLQMIEHYGQVHEPEALAGWLRTTARRECLQIVRDRRRAYPVDTAADRPDSTCDVEQRVVDADTARRLRKLMRRLPARSSMLLDFLFQENPPAYAELSRRTGIPVGSIGPTRARALRQLRQLIIGEAGYVTDARMTGVTGAARRSPALCCARRAS